MVSRGGFGFTIAQRRHAELDELVVPRGHAEKAILRFGSVAGHVEHRTLKARALGAILDGEIAAQVDLRIESPRGCARKTSSRERSNSARTITLTTQEKPAADRHPCRAAIIRLNGSQLVNAGAKQGHF